MKNDTIKWYSELPTDEKQQSNLAIKRQEEVQK